MRFVDEVFFQIIDLLNAGFPMVMPVVFATFSLILGSALFRLIVNWLAGSMGNMFGDIIILLVMFMIFLAFATSAQAIVDGIGTFALALGSGIVGARTMEPDDFGPSALWSIGSEQADSILATKNALCTSMWECTKTFGEQLLLEFAALCVYGAFAFLLFEMAMTIIGYKVHGLFMLLFLPTAILPFTKSFSEGAIQGCVNNLVKMTIIAMFAGVASQAFKLMDLPPRPVFDDIVPAVLLAGFVAFLAWQAKTLAAGVISAVPQLSGQAITRGAGNVMRAVATGGGAAASAALTGNREKLTIGQAASNIAAGVQRAPARIASAAASVQNGGAAAKSYWANVKAANSSQGTGGNGGSSSGAGASGAGNSGNSSAAPRPAQATPTPTSAQPTAPQPPSQSISSVVSNGTQSSGGVTPANSSSPPSATGRANSGISSTSVVSEQPASSKNEEPSASAIAQSTPQQSSPEPSENREQPGTDGHEQVKQDSSGSPKTEGSSEMPTSSVTQVSTASSPSQAPVAATTAPNASNRSPLGTEGSSEMPTSSVTQVSTASSPSQAPVAATTAPNASNRSPLGDDINSMSRTEAGAAIRERALALPKGTGVAGEPVGFGQRKEARVLGTNVDGMTKGQAAAAITAHKTWYGKGVASAKWQPQSNAHPYASDSRPTPSHMMPKTSQAPSSPAPSPRAAAQQAHGLGPHAPSTPNTISMAGAVNRKQVSNAPDSAIALKFEQKRASQQSSHYDRHPHLIAATSDAIETHAANQKDKGAPDQSIQEMRSAEYRTLATTMSGIYSDDPSGKKYIQSQFDKIDGIKNPEDRANAYRNLTAEMADAAGIKTSTREARK